MATELISLGVLFLCAIIGGIIATRFRQPAVFGMLLVGSIIGPNSLSLVKDGNMINIMAEFGAILILFIIGIDFDRAFEICDSLVFRLRNNPAPGIQRECRAVCGRYTLFQQHCCCCKGS